MESEGSSLVAVRGSPIAVASLVETGSRMRGLRSRDSRALELRLSGCGAWAQLLSGMWDRPGSGIELCLLNWQANSSPLSH